MQGQYNIIPFLGINTELLNDQSPDGLCEDIINLKPKGTSELPFWVPFERLNGLSNTSGTEFTYQHGLSNIKGAFWQIRNFLGRNSVTGNEAFKRLVVLCDGSSRKAIDIIDPAGWNIVKTQGLPSGGSYSLNCTRVNEVTVINVLRNKEPFLLYYLIDDKFIEQGFPEMPEIKVDFVYQTFSEEAVLAGNTRGIQVREYRQYFLASWAFSTFEGTFVKHSVPVLIEVPTGPNTLYLVPRFELIGYSTPIDDFWTSIISGIGYFTTMPRVDRQQALDDGVFYRVTNVSNIDRIPENEWVSNVNPNVAEAGFDSSVWPTLQVLNIDNFTHHKFAANVVDTYNSRLLIGGVSTDFALPTEIPSQELSVQVQGGPWTDYMAYLSGTATVDERYYDQTGTQVSSSQSYNYVTRDRQVNALFTPKPGREFKSAGLLQVNMPTPTYTAPHGEPFPTAQYNATLENGNLRLYHRLKEVANVAEFPSTPFMVISLFVGNLGEPADQIIQFYVTMPVGFGSPFYVFSEATVTFIGGSGTDVYQIVELNTDAGFFTRIRKQTLLTQAGDIILPAVLSYPDRRAQRFRIVVKNGNVYETAVDRTLVQHPNSNYAYAFLNNQERTYVLGSSITTASQAPSLAPNQIRSFIRNRIQASAPNNPFIFDALTNYRIGSRENDTVMGFAVNTIDISSGQFGQYPLIVFSDKSVWALEQSGDPTIAFARIVPLDTFNGIDNTNALCNAERLIIGADRNYIYSVAGQKIERIDRPISNHPDYKEFLKGIILAFHKAGDYEEVICSNPAFNYSWHYNLRYGAWYRGMNSYRLFFKDQPNIVGVTTGNIFQDFSNKNTNINTPWTLKTRPFNFGNKYFLKRLWKSQVRARIDHPENQAGFYPQIRVRLWGWKEAQESPFLVMDYTMSNKKTVKDLWLMTKFGAFNAYSLEVTGSSRNNGTFIHQVEANYENRYETRVRR